MLEIAYADPSFYKNCHPYFEVRDMQNPNIFKCQIFDESIFVDLSLTLYTHTPVCKHSK